MGTKLPSAGDERDQRADEETADSLGAIRDSISETSSDAEEVASATDDHAKSTEQVAATVDEAVDELADLEGQLTELNDIATRQYRQVEEIESAVDDLVSR
ncbi:MAG: hypothetical protein ABEJ40_06675 [Haloarculaceae archaeon]